VLLRYWRERRGYSLRGLAERARVGFATLHKIEQKQMSPTVDLLEKLARALKVSVRDLFPAGWPSRRTVMKRKQPTRRRQ
jgi:transcriptional regulator with XRE-family HTH domain